MAEYTLVQNLSIEPLCLPYPLIGVLCGNGQGVVADTVANVTAMFSVAGNDVGNIVNLRAVPDTTPATVGAVVASAVTTTGVQTLTNKTLTSPKIGVAILDTNGNEVIKTPATASAVNEVTITNAATGGSPMMSATGGDTNIGLTLKSKGASGVNLVDGSGNTLVSAKASAMGAAQLGFYGATPTSLQTGVAVSAAGIHAALVSLGLITA